MMGPVDTSAKTPRTLRDRAEAAWQSRHRDVSATPPEQLARMVHDVEVHQIELQLQNEELRRAQQELEESRQQFSDLYDFAPVGYLTLNQDRVIARANLKAASMLGVERGQLVGRHFTRFVQSQSQDELYLAQRATGANGESWSGELVLHKVDGSELPVAAEMLCVAEPGAEPRWRCVVSDITMRRAAERALRANEALRASEERHRELAEQVTEGIFVTDVQGRYVDANRAACDMLGYTLEQLKALGVEDVIPSDERARLPEQFQQLASGRTVRNEWRFRRKDGSIFIGELVARQLRDGRLLGVVRDTTERKQLEKEREEDARKKDEFLAFLGHELRNPLAAIHTAIQVLSRGATPAQRAPMEEIIGRQTAMMRRLVDDLLELERITHGHIELKRDRLDLAECLQRAVAAMQSTVSSRGQALLLRLPPESVPFMADGTRLAQIVGNLLSNASKYTGPGGRIELSGVREGSDVIVRCKDNGQGIAPEYQQMIFEPFASGTKTEPRNGEASLGLGLPLAKQLTELHGGTLSVESGGIGLGSEFVVRLPLVAPPSDQQMMAESKLAPTSRRVQSLVIIEDNISVAETLQIALEQAGHSVHRFADGPSALAGVSALKPAAVLIDIGLPGMDGYEVATKLKHQDSMKHTLCIAVSGFKRRREGDDFDQYFSKPVDVGALLDFLDQHG